MKPDGNAKRKYNETPSAIDARQLQPKWGGRSEEIAANEAQYRREVFDTTPHNTVQGEFERKKSLEADAYAPRAKNSRKERKERERALAQFYETQQNSERALALFQKNVGKPTPPAVRLASRKVVSRVTLRGALWIAGIISFWQVVFALLSLAGYGIHFYILDFKENTTVGKVVSWFVDLGKVIPAEYIGAGFWALAAIVAMGGFLAFMLFFLATNVRMFNSALSYLIFALCLGVSLLPISNIIPGLLLWVLYLNTNSLFSRT